MKQLGGKKRNNNSKTYTEHSFCSTNTCCEWRKEYTDLMNLKRNQQIDKGAVWHEDAHDKYLELYNIGWATGKLT